MRTLGGTGIKVTPYCPGAMMFGARGNPDHEESIRSIHAALDGGINFIDTAARPASPPPPPPRRPTRPATLPGSVGRGLALGLGEALEFRAEPLLRPLPSDAQPG